jgi:hypothetical protein
VKRSKTFDVMNRNVASGNKPVVLVQGVACCA